MDSDDSRVSRVSVAPLLEITQTPPRPSSTTSVIPDELEYQSQANAGIAETVRENCDPIALCGAFFTAGCRGRRSREAPRPSSCARTMSHHSHNDHDTISAIPQTTQRPRRMRDDSN